MSDQLFQDALAFVWRAENDGQPYHVTPGDAGGATAWGVTWRTWTAWLAVHAPDEVPVSLDDFERMKRDEFIPFYRGAFWNPIQGDSLPPGLGLMVFDAAVNVGVSRASRWLQRVVGVTQDGSIGPLTLKAVMEDADDDLTDLMDRFTAQRRQFYANLAETIPANRRFLNGWYRRAADAAVLGLALARAI